MAKFTMCAAPYAKCKQALIALRNATRKSPQTEGYFDWKYFGRPNGADSTIVLAKDAEHRPIGACSVTPHHVVINNRTHYIGKIEDVSVATEWRGRGVATRMFEYLPHCEATKGVAAFAVLPNKEASGPLLHAGWRPVSAIERYVKILRPGRELQSRIPSRYLPDAPFLLIDFAASMLSGDRYRKPPDGYRGGLVEAFDERFDPLWHAAGKSGCVIPLRDRGYLQWRYAHHPTIQHHIFALVRGAALAGYLVFHIVDNQYRIVDALSLDEDGAPRHLLCNFLEFARKGRTATSVLFRANPTVASCLELRARGFLKRPGQLTFMSRPVHADLVTPEWYLTAGDKDT